MVIANGIFKILKEADLLVVSPTRDLRELDFQAIETAAGKVFESLSKDHAKHVIIDLSGTDYYGSTALGFFVKLWKRVRDHGGKMAFCNMSAHELEVLQVTNLDKLWPLCESRAAAIEAVRLAGEIDAPDR
jgi:anti-anti-sigma factor